MDLYHYEIGDSLFTHSQLFCIASNQGLCKVTDNGLVYKSSCYRSCRCFSCFQPPPWFDISFGDSLPHTVGRPNQTLHHHTRENNVFSVRANLHHDPPFLNHQFRKQAHKSHYGSGKFLKCFPTDTPTTGACDYFATPP